MRYKVALRQSEEGFSVSCPGLPGCWSQGATEQEALANIQTAIREYLEAAAELNKDAEIREVEVSVGKLPGIPHLTLCVRWRRLAFESFAKASIS